MLPLDFDLCNYNLGFNWIKQHRIKFYDKVTMVNLVIAKKVTKKTKSVVTGLNNNFKVQKAILRQIKEQNYKD